MDQDRPKHKSGFSPTKPSIRCGKIDCVSGRVYQTLRTHPINKTQSVKERNGNPKIKLKKG
jgi:hypothetical protein